MLRRLLIPLALALMTAPAFAADAPPDPVDDLCADCDTFTVMSNDPIIEKEIFHVAGDAPDPSRESNARGVAPGYDMTKTATGRPLVHYELPGGAEMLLEIDVYNEPGEPMYLHLICPHCLMRDHARNDGSKPKMLTVRSQVKQMSYDPLGIPPTFPGWTDKQMVTSLPNGAGGLLSCERFKCTWEYDPRYRERSGNLCDFEIVIDRNVARRVTHHASGQLISV